MAPKGQRLARHGATPRHVESFEDSHGDETAMNEMLPERFKHRFEAQSHLEESSASYHQHRVAEYFSRTGNARPPTGWMGLTEIPTNVEICTPVEDLREPIQGIGGGGGDDDDHDDDEENDEDENNDDGNGRIYQLLPSDVNNVSGPWFSKKKYLKTQYKLLRADALRPLRKAVACVSTAKDMDEDDNNNSLGIYDNVYITGFNFANSGLAVRVRFSITRVGKNVKWEQSKRLTTGSLVVLLADDDTSVCKVAVVAARPLWMLNGGADPSRDESDTSVKPRVNQSPEIYLFFENANELEIDCHRKWIMVEERSGFFEAERYTLLALQKMVNETFPLSEYLVDLDTTVAAPKYVSERPHRDLSDIFRLTSSRVDDVDILGEWPKCQPTELDQSQLSALERILTKRLAIVQGPPGTGKTFVSVQALKVLLKNRRDGDPPIIITCQTNHALDQLLRHVQKFMPDYVRLGGRSKDEEVKKRTLFNLRESTKNRSKLAMKNLIKDMTDLLEPFKTGTQTLTLQNLLQHKIITAAQAKSIEDDVGGWVQADSRDEIQNPLQAWMRDALETVNLNHQQPIFDNFEETNLDFEDIKEADAEQFSGDGDLDEVLRGELVDVGDIWDGKTKDEQAWKNARAERIAMRNVAKFLKGKENMKRVDPTKRGDMYRYFLRKFKGEVLAEFRKKADQYLKLTKERRIDFWDKDVAFLQTQKVIGVTTTGFSKYRALLSTLRPKIVLIEEAAETLEAPVAATCVDSLEHLILVGDHKQLRPHCHVRELEESPWNLNVSLFERMINNNVEFDMLKRQRRMIPDVRRLLQPIYGNEIEDHPSVKDAKVRPRIPGMGEKSTWFFTHNWPEAQDHMRSSFNLMEADMIVHFIQYLMYNGVQARDITVLTFYNGQRRKLRLLLRDQAKTMRDPSIETDTKVVTVDSYQGEENKIVILSLVRSNHEGKIGFLGVDNRVCVALSRAQCGFYLFGNANLLYRATNTWKEVIDIMACGNNKDKTRIGPILPLRCQKHGKEMTITIPADWRANAGGCDIKCSYTLMCGHPCPNLCHPTDHQNARCQQACNKKLACGHLCCKNCGDANCRCGKCPDSGNSSSASSVRRLSPSKTVGSLHRLAQEAFASRRSSPSDWNRFAAGGIVDHDAAQAKALEVKAAAMRHQRLDDENSSLLFDSGDSDHHSPEPCTINFVKVDNGNGRQVWQSTHAGPIGTDGTGDAGKGGRVEPPSLLDLDIPDEERVMSSTWKGKGKASLLDLDIPDEERVMSSTWKGKGNPSLLDLDILEQGHIDMIDQVGFKGSVLAPDIPMRERVSGAGQIKGKENLVNVENPGEEPVVASAIVKGKGKGKQVWKKFA